MTINEIITEAINNPENFNENGFLHWNFVDYDLVAVETSDVDNETFESAVVLYGFDEISSLGEWGFNNPVLGFLSN